MRQEIASLHRRLGTTMIFVTHDQTEAMTLADRIVVINRQRIEQIGTRFRRHRSLDTATCCAPPTSQQRFRMMRQLAVPVSSY
jgi:ABC-type sugar transport system ATPase subunit